MGSNRARIKAKKLKLFKLQDGKCIWCGCKMIPPGTPVPDNTTPSPRLATLEHMNHRFDRRKHLYGDWKLACWICNHKRGAERVAQEPIERLREMSKQPQRRHRRHLTVGPNT